MIRTQIGHNDGSTTYIETNEAGDSRIYLESDGERREIGQEGSGLTHDEVVEMYADSRGTMGDTVYVPDDSPIDGTNGSPENDGALQANDMQTANIDGQHGPEPDGSGGADPTGQGQQSDTGGGGVNDSWNGGGGQGDPGVGNDGNWAPDSGASPGNDFDSNPGRTGDDSWVEL